MSLIAAAVAANSTCPGTSPAAGQPLSTSRQGHGVLALPMPHVPQGLRPPLPPWGRMGPRWHLGTHLAVHIPCLQTAQPGRWVFASGDTRDGDRFGVSSGGAPACARVVRVCQVAGAGWEQEGSVCVVPCAVLRAHSSLHEAPALLQCLLHWEHWCWPSELLWGRDRGGLPAGTGEQGPQALPGRGRR